MEIREFFECDNKEFWLKKLGGCDWGAGSYLCSLLADGGFHKLCGERSKVLLLTEGDELISFCTYAECDDIPDSGLTPWVGFVYTFPAFRGRRRIGKLLERAYALAKGEGHEALYVSTDQQGLYEHFGFSFLRMMKDARGNDSLVYTMDVVGRDYGGVIGKTVRGTVDRPLGSRHPKHPDMVYPLNYGYVDGVQGGDGDWQDVYILGANGPLDRFEGKVVGVYHRLNDVEDKWIVSLDGRSYTDGEILAAIEFQEQFFMGELYC